MIRRNFLKLLAGLPGLTFLSESGKAIGERDYIKVRVIKSRGLWTPVRPSWAQEHSIEPECFHIYRRYEPSEDSYYLKKICNSLVPALGRVNLLPYLGFSTDTLLCENYSVNGYTGHVHPEWVGYDFQCQLRMLDPLKGLHSSVVSDWKMPPYSQLYGAVDFNQVFPVEVPDVTGSSLPC